MTHSNRSLNAYVLWTLTIVAAICLLHYSLLYQGHSWSGDFSQYIHHAKNLVEGNHYADTGYIVSGASRFVGPYTYPPVFPVLLTPVYMIDGLNLELLKLVPIASLCLVLLLLPKLFALKLSYKLSLFAVVLIGCNPFLSGYCNEILSDFSFIFFSYLALHQMQMLLDAKNPTTENQSLARVIVSACGLGLLMYLAYGCREVGIIMPLCVVTYAIVIARRISIVSILSIVVFAILAYTQHKLLNVNFTPEFVQQNLAELARQNNQATSIGHFDFINLDQQAILSKLQQYRWAMHKFLPITHNGVLRVINVILFNAFLLIALAGYLISLIRKITVLEIFFAGYVAVLLLFGAPAYTRYLLPIYPLIIYYVCIAVEYGLKVFSNKSTYRSIKYTCLGAFIAVLLIYGNAIKNNNYDVITFGVEHPQSVAMFDFIRNNTSPNDTIVFRKPRTMALFTQRMSIGNPEVSLLSATTFNDFFEAAQADYFVDVNINKWLQPLKDSSPPSEAFNVVFRNDYFVVYHYMPRASEIFSFGER